MKKLILRSVLILLVFSSLRAQNRDQTDCKKYWVFFKDKSSMLRTEGLQNWNGTDLGISKRALIRRAKVRDKDRLFDFLDLPVAEEYIQALKNLDLTVHVISRWLNSVSVFMSQDQVDHVSVLPFVQQIQPVRSLSFLNRKLSNSSRI
jgi:hypothetical protein